MTRGQQIESECRGYEIEYRCLESARRGATGDEQLRLIRRQRQLKDLGRKRFGCQVKEWDKKKP
jgi:hypothetical protein